MTGFLYTTRRQRPPLRYRLAEPLITLAVAIVLYAIIKSGVSFGK